MGDNPGRQFCSRSCATTSRMAAPEARTRSREHMRRIRERADVQEKLRLHLASESNPLRNPDNRLKSTQANRERGFPHLNGGNGTAPPLPQKILADWLGWPMEHVVGTGEKGRGIPTHYKIDLANPKLRIAIEVDGKSHKGRKTRESDRKKDSFLEGKGWTVLRFQNEEVMDDLERVKSLIMSSISRRERATTSRPDSSSTTLTS